jgi:hypothetical protein
MHLVSAVTSAMCACSYVSFVEILSTKAVEGFEEAGYGEAQAQRYACFAFFAGLMATWLLGKAVQLVSSCATGWRKHRVSRGSSCSTATSRSTSSTSPDTASTCSRQQHVALVLTCVSAGLGAHPADDASNITATLQPVHFEARTHAQLHHSAFEHYGMPPTCIQVSSVTWQCC